MPIASNMPLSIRAIALIVGLESMGILLPGETIWCLHYAAADPPLNIWVVIAV
jgi:hypothetical protein